MYNVGDLLKTKMYDFMFTCDLFLFISCCDYKHKYTNICTYICTHTERKYVFLEEKNLNHWFMLTSLYLLIVFKYKKMAHWHKGRVYVLNESCSFVNTFFYMGKWPCLQENLLRKVYHWRIWLQVNQVLKTLAFMILFWRYIYIS